MAMVYDTLPTLAAGRPVLSTVRLLDPSTGEPHPLWSPLGDYQSLMEAEHCDVLLDEVTGVASSRESAGMPAAVANLLVQLRRRDVALRWTAPSWKRADTIIRECSQAVTICYGFAPARMRSEDGTDRQWSSKRVFYWRTYDAATFDEWTAHKRERLRPVARQVMYRPGSVAERAYDTFDAVLSLGSVTDAGTCVECDGHRVRRQCSCPDYLASRAAASTRARKPVELAGPVVLPGGGRRVLIAETDDTPGVVMETARAS